MNPSDWYQVFQFGSAVAGGIAFICLVGIWITGSMVNRASAQQIRSLELRIAEQQERAAKAETDLLELKKRFAPRQFPANTFIASLKSTGVVGKAEIWCIPNDQEAFAFAVAIMPGLMHAGWKVTGIPIPIPEDAMPHGLPNAGMIRTLPPMLRAGAEGPLSIVINPMNGQNGDHTFGALHKAFQDAGFEAKPGVDSGLHAGLVRIVVGPRF